MCGELGAEDRKDTHAEGSARAHVDRARNFMAAVKISVCTSDDDVVHLESRLLACCLPVCLCQVPVARQEKTARPQERKCGAIKVHERTPPLLLFRNILQAYPAVYSYHRVRSPLLYVAEIGSRGHGKASRQPLFVQGHPSQPWATRPYWRACRCSVARSVSSSAVPWRPPLHKGVRL